MNKTKKLNGVNKGGPSGFVISVLVHAGAISLAGLLVVFTVHQKEEKQFVPPQPVERPKMKLKKPKVKVRKSAKPKSATRIVTKVTKADMPDIRLPEMSGMGEGFAGGAGGDVFGTMPDLEEITLFGGGQSIGSDLEGTFYDFNRRRSGTVYALDSASFKAEITRFLKKGWRPATLAKYYRSPKKLYATTIAVPPIKSTMAPSAFDEPDARGRTWMVHYTGQLVHKDGIKFRFVSNSDDVMVIRVDGETVLDGCRGGPGIDWSWQPDTADHRKWYMAHDFCGVGQVVELEPGVPKDLDILIGESPGGLFNAILCVKEEGVDYPENQYGEPILPLFKTSQIPRRLQDMIYRGMPEDQVDVINGPVFNDYDSISEEADAMATVGGEPEPLVEPAGAASGDSGMRTWTSKDGQTIEAEYVCTMAGVVVLKTPDGKTRKIPVKAFSESELSYLSLNQPPKLKLDMGKKIRQKRLKWDEKGEIGMNDYIFSPKVDCSHLRYDHELKVDFWAIGSEIGSSKYILLDQGGATFNPSDLVEAKGRFTFSGRTVTLYDWLLANDYQQRQGESYAGFLITVTDERGEIIAHRESPTWLYKHVDQLRQLETGSFMNNKAERIWPTPLKSNR